MINPIGAAMGATPRLRLAPSIFQHDRDFGLNYRQPQWWLVYPETGDRMI